MSDYEDFLDRNGRALDRAADTMVRGDFCQPWEGEDVARVLGLTAIGRVRWRGRWEEALEKLDGSLWWRASSRPWADELARLLGEARIMLSADGAAVLVMERKTFRIG